MSFAPLPSYNPAFLPSAPPNIPPRRMSNLSKLVVFAALSAISTVVANATKHSCRELSKFCRVLPVAFGLVFLYHLIFKRNSSSSNNYFPDFTPAVMPRRAPIEDLTQGISFSPGRNVSPRRGFQSNPPLHAAPVNRPSIVRDTVGYTPLSLHAAPTNPHGIHAVPASPSYQPAVSQPLYAAPVNRRMPADTHSSQANFSSMHAASVSRGRIDAVRVDLPPRVRNEDQLRAAPLTRR